MANRNQLTTSECRLRIATYYEEIVREIDECTEKLIIGEGREAEEFLNKKRQEQIECVMRIQRLNLSRVDTINWKSEKEDEEMDREEINKLLYQPFCFTFKYRNCLLLIETQRYYNESDISLFKKVCAPDVQEGQIFGFYFGAGLSLTMNASIRQDMLRELRTNCSVLKLDLSKLSKIDFSIRTESRLLSPLSTNYQTSVTKRGIRVKNLVIVYTMSSTNNSLSTLKSMLSVPSMVDELDLQIKVDSVEPPFLQDVLDNCPPCSRIKVKITWHQYSPIVEHLNLFRQMATRVAEFTLSIESSTVDSLRLLSSLLRQSKESTSYEFPAGGINVVTVLDGHDMIMFDDNGMVKYDFNFDYSRKKLAFKCPDIGQNWSNLRELTIRKAAFQFHTIYANDLAQFTQIEVLRLDMCSLKHISSNAFANMKNLTKLEIIDVEFSKDDFSWDFLGPVKEQLLHFELFVNQTMNLSYKIFDGMTRLNTLMVTCNNAVVVSLNDEGQLFPGVTRIKHLELELNEIRWSKNSSDIEMPTVFGDMTELETLNLALGHQSSVLLLNESANLASLTTFSLKFFEFYVDLKPIDPSGMAKYVTEMKEDSCTFAPACSRSLFPNIRRKIVHGYNKTMYMPDSASLEELILTDYKLSSVEFIALSQLTHLKYLELNMSAVTQRPTSYDELTKGLNSLLVLRLKFGSQHDKGFIYMDKLKRYVVFD